MMDDRALIASYKDTKGKLNKKLASLEKELEPWKKKIEATKIGMSVNSYVSRWNRLN